MVSLPNKINYHVQNVEIWRRKLECADLISECDVWCQTSHAHIKTQIVGEFEQNQSYLSPFYTPISQ